MKLYTIVSNVRKLNYRMVIELYWEINKRDNYDDRVEKYITEELHEIQDNINMTACDYLSSRFTEEEADEFLQKIPQLNMLSRFYAKNSYKKDIGFIKYNIAPMEIFEDYAEEGAVSFEIKLCGETVIVSGYPHFGKARQLISEVKDNMDKINNILKVECL